MVVIDEKSRVPAIGEEALKRLSHALDQKGVVAAMLIGSQARGNSGPLSDVDIAVWHDADLDSRTTFSLKPRVASSILVGRMGCAGVPSWSEDTRL